MSSPLPCWRPASPPSRPASARLLIQTSMRALAQRSRSSRRLICRSTLRPQIVCPGLKRSVLKGIATSAAQPSLVMRVRASQMPSHSRLGSCALFEICPSARAPAGFTEKKKPLRWSKNGSRTIVTRSSTSRSASRPSCVATIAVRRAVATEDPEVEVVDVEGDPHLGLLAGRRALDGVALDERADRGRRATTPSGRERRRRGYPPRPRPWPGQARMQPELCLRAPLPRASPRRASRERAGALPGRSPWPTSRRSRSADPPDSPCSPPPPVDVSGAGRRERRRAGRMKKLSSGRGVSKGSAPTPEALRRRPPKAPPAVGRESSPRRRTSTSRPARLRP